MRKTVVKKLKEHAIREYSMLSIKARRDNTFKNFFRYMKDLYVRGELSV